MVDTCVTVLQNELIETNNALEGKTMTRFSLMIERKYGDQPSGWWPAYGDMSEEEANECLDSYPPVYGEVSRRIVPEGGQVECSERFLRSCGG